VSGRGVHILAHGTIPVGVKRLLDGHKVEMYSTTRFFTWSGQLLLGTPATIEARQSEITALYQQIAPPPVVTVIPAQVCAAPCEDVAALLHRARNDKKFTRLWKGDTSRHGGDESRADLALVRKLAFYTGGDVSRIDALFRQSGLMRPKWDEVHYGNGQTYGEHTIEKVVGGPTVHTQPSPETDVAPPQSDEERLDALGERLNYPPLPISVCSTILAGKENWQKAKRWHLQKMLLVAVAVIHDD
jgi:putative DNA primase/helicase